MGLAARVAEALALHLALAIALRLRVVVAHPALVHMDRVRLAPAVRLVGALQAHLPVAAKGQVAHHPRAGAALPVAVVPAPAHPVHPAVGVLALARQVALVGVAVPAHRHRAPVVGVRPVPAVARRPGFPAAPAAVGAPALARVVAAVRVRLRHPVAACQALAQAVVGAPALARQVVLVGAAVAVLRLHRV